MSEISWFSKLLYKVGGVTGKRNPVTGGIKKYSGSTVLDQRLKINPSSVILPASASNAAGGWSTNGDCSLSMLSETYNGRSIWRMSSTTGAAAGYPKIRRKIPVTARMAAHGRIEIPVRIPYGLGVGEIQITVSSDEPANDPPSADPTNSAMWDFRIDQFRQGQWQIITIDPSATIANSTRIGQAWSANGTPDMTALKYIDIYVYFAGSAGVPGYVDFSDICSGGYATPYVLIGFDGAGQDPNHLEYAARRLNKWGLKAIFSVQGQIPTLTDTGQKALIAKLKADGHDFGNEGLNHTNYVSSPATLSADVDTAIANFATLGITAANSGIGQVFCAPQEALNAIGSGLIGLDTLKTKGFRFCRSGNKHNFIAPSSVGPDAFFGVCPVVVGVTSDTHDASVVATYLDAAELHGSMIQVMFHSIVASGASGTQTDLSVYNTVIDDIGARCYAGRMINGTPSLFLDEYKDATGYTI
jgi:hypothetical protein